MTTIYSGALKSIFATTENCILYKIRGYSFRLGPMSRDLKLLKNVKMRGLTPAMGNIVKTVPGN